MTQQTTPSHPELVRVLEKHIWYELARFIAQYELLRNPATYRAVLDKKNADHVEDALIVSFCTHARNLLEFFWRRHRTKWNYALATDYADASYVPVKKKKGSDIDRLYGQLCEQINHLGLNRTDHGHEKIQAPERDELVRIIHDEVERLLKHLRPGFDGRYFASESLAAAKRKSMTINPGAAGPSNEVQFFTSLQQATHTTTPQLGSGPVTIAVSAGPTGTTEPGGGGGGTS